MKKMATPGWSGAAATKGGKNGKTVGRSPKVNLQHEPLKYGPKSDSDYKAKLAASTPIMMGTWSGASSSTGGMSGKTVGQKGLKKP